MIYISVKTLNELPFEVLDTILMNSFLCWILEPASDQREDNVIKTLASVDFCWFQRVTKQRFKKRIWGQIKAFYGKTRRRSSIIRNNGNYLLENIQPNEEFFESLLDFNCVTEDESRFIQRQRSNRDKNAELLYAMRSFDERKFSGFVKCLRQTNQKTVARVLENGGGVIKVKMWNGGETFVEKQLFHHGIEDLQNKTKPLSHETDLLIGQLREDGIEVLNSRLDRQNVIIWICCRSQAGLKNIQKMYESNQLRDVLFALAKVEPSTFQAAQSKLINIDRIEFKKTVVVRPISVIATDRVDVGRVFGVTKLRNKIYVLGQTTSAAHVIRVFEDQNPFRLQEKIKVKSSIENENGCYDFGDIVSSDSQNCLYVSGEKKRFAYPDSETYRPKPNKSQEFYDSVFNYIWKITRETDEQHKAIKWLTIDYEPSTLSVTCDSRLLVVPRSSTTLMIYASNAELIRSIKLPRDVKKLRHAVETSIGSFIITHDTIEVEEEEEIESGHGRRHRETKHVVSEFTSDGRTVIRRFINFNKTQQLEYPSYLSLDADDRVYVLDGFNDRVILLDSNLKWNQILLSINRAERWTGIGYLHRMFYDKEKKQLILAGLVSHGLNVYTLG